MSTGKAGFPGTQNGYSPLHVDDFIVALAQRATTQITTLEQRVADRQAHAAASSCVELEERIAKLERGIADRDAQLSEEGARVAMLQRRISELEAGQGGVVEFDPVDEVVAHDPIQEEPQDWAASVIGRSSYQAWADEQRARAEQALRRKRLSACTPAS